MEIYVNELLAKLRDAKIRKVLPPPKRKLSTATCLKGFQAYLNLYAFEAFIINVFAGSLASQFISSVSFLSKNTITPSSPMRKKPSSVFPSILILLR
jgi:hypothetical protein